MRSSLPPSLALLLSFSLACGDKQSGGSGGTSNDADSDGYTKAVDCDDANPAIHPGAEELCDGLDNDCSGAADDASGIGSVYFADGDGDGFGDEASSVEACALPEGYVEDAADCDDASASVHPGADELCNEQDDDCDGATDEEPVNGVALYADADGDGHGDPDTEVLGCAEGDGLVLDAADCDDAEPASFPGNDELCDGIDNDCDGDPDDEDPDVIGQTEWFSDRDGDGYGDSSHSTVSCEAPLDYVAAEGDCDDFEPDAFPGNTEFCDGIDNDCDGETDPSTSLDAKTWYTDFDGDAYGDPATMVSACEAEAEQVADGTDCDDTNGESHPGAAELCDGEDNDCDPATVDEGIATFWDGAGVATDYTATMSGTSSAPSSVTMADDGDLWICPGTWYTNLTIEANVSIAGIGAAANVILDGASQASVITIATDGLVVAMSDVMLQNGVGSNYDGGGIYCHGESQMTLDGLVIGSNIASNRGGGIFLENCDLNAADTVINGNDAEYGGGVAAYGTADLEFDDCSVSGNTATYGGGIRLRDTSTLSLTYGLVEGNMGEQGAGVSIADQASFKCIGDATTTAGVLGNLGPSAAVGLLGDASAPFTASACDLGTAAGGDDNDPEDLLVGSYSYLYGDDQTFTCDSTRCGTATTTTVGTGASNYGGLTAKARGNIFTATADTTLERFDAYVNPDSGCGTYYWYLLSASSPTAATWTIEGSGTESTSTTSAGFITMSPVGLPIVNGTTYAVVYAWPSTCSLAYYYEQGASSYSAGIGTISGYHWDDSSFSSSNYSGSTVSAKVQAKTVAFYMKLNTSH